MNRRKLAWFMALAVLTLLVGFSAPAFPWQGADPEPGKEPEAPAGEEAGDDAVESILRQQEEASRSQRFAYEPSGRRDPFRSLYEASLIDEGDRPKGIAGMLVSELDLSGMVKDANQGDVAMVMGSDNKGYFLRVGDSVYDATVIAVDPRLGAVTFRQKVDDPRLIKPYRDVVMRLVPLEESTDE